MHILLFDIDGTLIRSGGAGKAAMETGLKKAFNLQKIDDTIPYSGRTDVAIAHDLLRVHGLEVHEENIAKLHNAYQDELPESLKNHDGEILPGIREFLPRLHACPNVVLGLLTGNIRRGAENKLRFYGLWDYFPFGGFADGIPDRDEVARKALKEAERHAARPADLNKVWVIGDTPFDVKCARAIGAKAIAVHTGGYNREALAATNADHLFNDFTEAHLLMAEWGA